MNIITLFPDRRAELNLDDEVWKGMLGKLGEFRQLQEWGSLSLMAMYLALLFPDRRHELNLDDEVWKGMLGKLGELRQAADGLAFAWSDFSEMALNLTILAAEDARITPDGRIEITPKQRKLATEPPPLPQRPR